MCAHHVAQPRPPAGATASWLAWLGGGNRLEAQDRSAYAVVGVVVLINAALCWLAATLAIRPAMHGSVAVPFTLAFAVLVGATGRVIAMAPTHGIARRAAAAVALALVLGVVGGECAALAMFSGSIDRLVEQQAARTAASAPTVVEQSANLQSMRETRAALDQAVDAARGQRDEALVVARCEYHPTTACPQTQITGVPGAGPETRTANTLLEDSQHELDQAVAARASQAPALGVRIDDGERLLDQARRSAAAQVDRGVGTRWIALQRLTFDSAGMLTVHLMTVAFFVFLSLLPLIFRHWRGETSHDRRARAQTERETAELLAETAIAVKRAEVRAAAESLWAEQQLEHARLAVQAQTEIDRAQLSQQVTAAIEAASPQTRSVDDDIYLPIAAEAHAASVAAAEPANVPAVLEAGDAPAVQAIPSIPDITRAAARWVRPLVPDIVTRAIDTSTHPFRAARHVIEEVEHITFSLKRTRRITVETEERSSAPRDALGGDGFVATNTVAASTSPDDQSLAAGHGVPPRELITREGRRELRGADGPRQLPPAG